MKYNYLFIFLLIPIIFCSCDKVEWDLKRDNLLDYNKNGVTLQFSNYDIVGDNNNDGIINKGETVYLKVYISNSSSGNATSVKATFSTSNTYVSLFSPTSPIVFGDIAGGTSEFGQTGYANSGYYSIKFTVSNTAPDNTPVPINIIITDESGNTWNSNFSVTIQGTGSQLVYSNHNIVGDNNNDGNINKGETVYLKVYIANNGSSNANAVKATFSISSAYVSLLSPTSQIVYGDIAAGTSEFGQTGYATSGYYTIKFTVSNSVPDNTQLPINIIITDESGNSWISNFSVTVQGTGSHLAYSSHNVVGDNNNDGIINKGETVYLKVYIANNGSSTANAVKATFSISNSYVSLLSPTSPILYGDIAAGSSEFGQTGYATSGYYTIKFTVSNTAPDNTQLPINIIITDENGNSWAGNFSATVQGTGAHLAYSKHNIVGDNNNDGIINKGETVFLKVYIVNNGSSTANALKATFAISSSYVSLLSPTSQIVYGDIAAGSSEFGQTGYATSGYYTIKFTVSGSTPSNTNLPINISIKDESLNTWTDSFNALVY